ncbi:trna (guanine37-n1) -methyltransferase [hydrocarbon metagenome]|uniref:tRNA (guanine-N(1)-)-methyltransferase n=1 Tax=hydrocarbon metagenome TaxID=938273 RepID=A0A0W8E8B3_9ZZZZ
MKIDVLTLFPQVFSSTFEESIIKRAREKSLAEIMISNIRDYTTDKHRQVDDYPYGGGPGMVMKADVVEAAINHHRTNDSWVIYMSPQGRVLEQKRVEDLANKDHLIILCGHYEGIDERAADIFDEEISIGDYILTGGEIPAMVLIDSVVRLIPGVLGDAKSLDEESFSASLLEYPHYTRPAVYANNEVPSVLLSGHHENIRKWRKKQSLLRTLLKRPDLLLKHQFDDEEKQMLYQILFDRENKTSEEIQGIHSAPSLPDV